MGGLDSIATDHAKRVSTVTDAATPVIASMVYAIISQVIVPVCRVGKVPTAPLRVMKATTATNVCRSVNVTTRDHATL